MWGEINDFLELLAIGYRLGFDHTLPRLRTNRHGLTWGLGFPLRDQCRRRFPRLPHLLGADG